MERAKRILEPLLDARDEGVKRLNVDQESDSMVVKRRAAQALADADDRLVRKLAAEVWPQQVAPDVAKLIDALNREYPAISTMAEETTDAREFYDLTMRHVIRHAEVIPTLVRSIEIKLGIEEH